MISIYTHSKAEMEFKHVNISLVKCVNMNTEKDM